MKNMYVELVLITATTVGKIMLCSVAGMLVSKHFSHPETSKRGLSFIAMKVLLPCLLFSNLCLNITWEQLGMFYMAPLFAFLPMSLGFLCSFLVRAFLAKDYRFVVILGSTFQNGLTFPISIVLNLKGIEWFTGQAVVDAQSYIFLYNLVCSIGLWAVGDPLIGYAKSKEVEAEEVKLGKLEAEQRRQHYLAMGSAGEAAAYRNRSFSFPYEAHRRESREDGDENAEDTGPHSPILSQTVDERREATAREQLGWYRPADQRDRPIVAPEGSPVVLLDGELNIADVKEMRPRASDRLRSVARTISKSLRSPPVLSSLLGIFISLTPPLRWLAQSFAGDAIIGGMTLIGEGAIPLQLLVLGITIVGSRPTENESSTKKAATATTSNTMSSPSAASPAGGAAPQAETANVSSAVPAAAEVDAAAAAATVPPGMEPDGTIMDVNTTTATSAGAAVANSSYNDDDDTNACVRWITSKVPPQIIFTWSTVLLRLVVIPTICLGVLHVLLKAGLMPKKRPFILSMLVGSMSPTAINSSLICAMHGYHAKDYSRMIFCMYVSAIFTSTIWLFIYVLYLAEESL